MNDKADFLNIQYRNPDGSRPSGACPVNSVTHRQGESLPVILHPSVRRLVSHSSVYLTSGYNKPASGYRTTDGSMNNEGKNGYSWSATPSSDAVKAFNLNFNSGNVNPSNENNRSNGRPVRCVRAFTVVKKSAYVVI